MNYINELIEIGMGNVIDTSADKYITKDEIYIRNMEMASDILVNLKSNLSEENIKLFEEYMDYIMNANERACIISYLAGAKNALKFVQN